MSSEMSSFFIQESNGDILDQLLYDFVNLKKFDDYLKVLSFYHVERCETDNCSQCIFAINLRYILTEPEIRGDEDETKLRYYCIMRKEHVIASSFFIHRLALIERQQIKLGKDFKEVLSIWNQKTKDLPAPLLNLGQ